MIFKSLCGFLALVFLVLPTGCAFFFGSGSDDSGQPDLSDGDFPDTSPCSDRDIKPDDSVFLDTLGEATGMIHIHKVYTTDAELPAVCGLADEDNALATGEVGWDPSAGTDAHTCQSFDADITAFLTSPSGLYYAGICRSGFGFESEDETVDGFPRGGTYRTDVCIEVGEKSYLVRYRIGVSGENDNKTWESVDIESVSDLEFFSLTSDEITSVDELKTLLIDNPFGTTITVRTGDGVTTHFQVVIKPICILSTSTACTAADEDEVCGTGESNE